MRYLMLLAVLLVMAACGPTPAPRVVDPATVIWQDVPIPQGAVRSKPSDDSDYTVPNRTVDDIVAFYIAHLPERAWIFDKKSSMLEESAEMGKGLRNVTGCRTDGAFVSATIGPSGSAARVLLVKSRDQDTLNLVATLNTGRGQMNNAGNCPR